MSRWWNLVQGLGAHVTAGVAPQHFSKQSALLFLTMKQCQDGTTLRLESDRLAVIEGLKSGVISAALRRTTRLTMRMRRMFLILPKHHLPGLKPHSLWLDYWCMQDISSLDAAVEKMSYNPALLYDFDAGYRAGAVDGPADLIIFDPEADRLVSIISLQKRAIHHLWVKH